MKIPFDIKYRPQIDSKEYKVVTRDGKPVRIICWDRKSTDKYCIIALVNTDNDELYLSFTKDGKYAEPKTKDNFDLFIITPELTEFEKAVAGWMEKAKDEPITNEMIVDAADNLMFCARKEIVKELTKEDHSMELKGWIARDKCGDLYVYHYTPRRRNSVFDESVIMELPEDSFPEVTWGNSPVEVKIKIEKV